MIKLFHVTWLGQAGLLFENQNLKIIVDPYLSDSVKEINPKNYRRCPIDKSFLKAEPDIIICTHEHLDHLDPETLAFYLNGERRVTVLAPANAWNEIRKFGGHHNYVLFNRYSEWSANNIRFTAVKAEHSDPTAIGVIIDDGEKKYYITGDTLFNSKIFDDIRVDIDVLFLPINGAGNNMNYEDARRFAGRINAKKVVPVHWGMFDEVDPYGFNCNNKVIPTIYKEVEL